MNHLKIAALIVAYRDKNAVENCVKALQSQSRPLDLIIIVDNSGQAIFTDSNSLGDKIVMIKPDFNVGVSGALNEGFQYCIKNGIEWCWTFDQDSVPYSNALAELLYNLPWVYKKYGENIGILASTGISKVFKSLYRGNYASWLPHKTQINRRFLVYECDLVLTAGSMVNLTYVKLFGGPRKELFLDWVDFNYCIEILKNKYKIISCNSSFYMHQIGQDITYVDNADKALIYKKLRLYLLIRNAVFTILYTSWGAKRFLYLFYFIFREYKKEIRFIHNNKLFGLYLSGILDGATKSFANLKHIQSHYLTSVIF